MDQSEDFRKLLNDAYFFLKFRPRSKKEMRDYLHKKIIKHHFSRDDVAEVLRYLEEREYISDKTFVQWFVEQRVLLKPKSVFVLKKELQRFGVDSDLIDEYFSVNKTNEEELAIKSLRTRWNRLERVDKKKRFEKAAAFLMRRGFSFDIVKKTIHRLENGENNS